MDAFSMLKSVCCTKQFVSFENLPVGDYFVEEFALVNTKFGTRIRVDIGDKVVFLPERFSKNMTSEKVNELNNSPKLMCYKGKDASKHNK